MSGHTGVYDEARDLSGDDLEALMPGVREVAERLGATSLRGPMAYSGKPGCTGETGYCTVLSKVDGTVICVGWHCGVCDEPSSQYGHKACNEQDS